MKSTNWIQHPLQLMGERASLLPLEHAHFNELCLMAKERSIWEYSPIGVNGYEDENHLPFLQECLSKRSTGEFYPFVVIENSSEKIIGFTIFHSIKEENKSLEIGCTWFHPDYWSQNFNTECKYLMLHYCFETLGTIRVQLKANDNNIRSRKAIEKIGGKFEGILRKDKILENGVVRNAAYYSIIDEDWNAVKAKILNLVGTNKI